MNISPVIRRHMDRLASPHGEAAPGRTPSFVQPVSVKEASDSMWQIADQHGVAMMSFGQFPTLLRAHRALMTHGAGIKKEEAA